jgi:2,4-dichlorophenol 6-monooxygenase
MGSRDVDTPVLIVGGGGAGLTASMLLSTYGVESLLVNDRPSTSRLPKAHMLNQRTMEIFDEVGVADAVYARGTPPAQMRSTGWYAGLGGSGADRGRLIGRIEIWGAGYEDPDYVAASPCRTANLPQMNLEPLLRARAEELAGRERVRFHHELVALEQNGAGVSAVVHDHDAGTKYRVRARYVIGADAGRTVGPAVGIALAEQAPWAQMVTIFMTADLSRWLWDDEVVSYHLINPDVRSTLETGTLMAAGPDHWGPRSEQWYLHLMYPVGSPDAFDDEAALHRMRSVLGVPDLEADVHVISRWTIYGALADRFRAGRCFVAGDAAHRNPPMGGLGLNSAIGDVGNLCWKLESALAGRGGEALLDSYEAERRPYCEGVIARALENSRRGTGLHEALGIHPSASPEENWRALREIWSDDPASEPKRRAVRGILQRHSMDYRDLNVEVGLPYGDSPLVLPDGSEEPVSVDPIRVYRPTTRPGHPLPHAWVEDGSQRRSLRQVAPGRWLLICGEDARSWCEAARALAAERALPLTAIQVGHADGDWFDIRCAWLRQREIAPTGCVLARPDRYGAWRSLDGAGDPASTLADVFDALVARER